MFPDGSNPWYTWYTNFDPHEGRFSSYSRNEWASIHTLGMVTMTGFEGSYLPSILDAKHFLRGSP